MSKGVLIFAFNNDAVDYVAMAAEAARRVTKYLGLPVTLVTDSSAYVEKIEEHNKFFDTVIDIWKDPSLKEMAEAVTNKNLRIYHDGSLSQRKSNFKNSIRTKTYMLSPYDETLVIDCDYFIANDNLKYCWEQDRNFLIYKSGVDLTGYRNTEEFEKVSDYTIDFYWATVFWFRKCNETETFFNLVDHIRENWDYYKMVYQFASSMYRNDQAFSMAIHLMNGYTQSDWAGKIPGRLLYTIDKDILVSMTDDAFKFLLEKQNRNGEYTAIKITGCSVHIMNKFSIQRVLKGSEHV